MENKEIIGKMKEAFDKLGEINSDVLSVTGDNRFVKSHNRSQGVVVSPYEVLQQYEKLREMANEVYRLMFRLKE